MLNNPLKYSDPSGEFAWLIVGAIIGGAINWATHGAEFSWKGLGYFAVGAAATYLGITAATAMAGTFAAGTTGFYYGSAVGAAGGAAGGFVSGMGNSLVDGDSLISAFGSGIEYGVLGGVTGALIEGGIEWSKSIIQDIKFSCALKNLSIEAGKPVPATDEFLKKAQKYGFLMHQWIR